VRHVRRDAPRAAGSQLALLVGDAEPHRAAQHDPELLVRVLMLRHVRARVELDDGKRELRAVDAARRDAVPDGDRPEAREVCQRVGYVSGVRRAASLALSSGGMGSETATRT